MVTMIKDAMNIDEQVSLWYGREYFGSMEHALSIGPYCIESSYS